MTLCQASARVVLLHLSDYHSHAVPFFSEGRHDQGGIARAIGYFEREKKRGALVFSGGDMMNKGAPAWSDDYTCAEWPWLNGLVSASALGNHDVDYGIDAFEKCRASVTYPFLSANTKGFPSTGVFKAHGIRVGVFALAGDDFPSLTKGLTFTDRLAAARAAVASLRKAADVIVLIGHETREEDVALAKQIDGIDVILGTHSHLKEELHRIDGTKTWFISPGQYLTYISRVELTFDRGRLTHVGGGLVRVDDKLPADATVAKRVAAMQKQLEAKHPELFAPIGTLAKSMSQDEVGQRTVELMRELTHADVALSTTSSFRQDLPAGTLTLELLRDALPYDNEIVVATLTGAELKKAMNDAYVTKIDLDPTKSYLVATTDYLAKVHAYKVEKSGLRVRDELRKALTATPSPARSAPPRRD